MKQRSLSKAVLRVAIATILLLMIPFLAMQFTDEVEWGPGDFIVMGILLFSAGFSFVLITRYTNSIFHRLAVMGAIGTTFLMVWANLAVGLIGSGPNPGNLMYLAVIGVIIGGTVLSNFTAKGMERTMFATTFTLVLHTVIALLTNMQEYPESSVASIIYVNGFFATLYAVSGLLFRHEALNKLTTSSESDQVR
ncbi:MAG: hypothetical protein A3D31_06100 [Candidatus Fluviicola riflensis]|nr:MAG: hypothetical protein CHH17_08915 [Candidatus Fluviicola riflensis]OGS79535.1 MAG: hypothetical protein A3D31_06100 [Candidatus Fluviicola riflensis]OGS86966.1 MAG: hypothetical protein A2724_05560 [Fluviicola sp. RIFCSPHIGHO2_01_FULL_43_53]OGS89757.1 MAG: hypothetical protein A3E30_02305 [Fluviicola sp. RIFCSPHIGHO2_12_FULL_43_24]